MGTDSPFYDPFHYYLKKPEFESMKSKAITNHRRSIDVEMKHS